MTVKSNVVCIQQGTDFEYDLLIQKEDGSPESLVGWTLIRLKKKGSDGNVVFNAPLTSPVDAVHTLNVDVDPASGSFKLQYTDADMVVHTTTAITAGAAAAAVSAAVNVLQIFSAVGATGTGTNADPYVLTYTSADGGRAQALPVVVEASLLTGASAVVTMTPASTATGVAENGIQIINDVCGHLRVKGSEAESLLLDLQGVDGVLRIRIGTRDLPIKTLKNLYKVGKDELVD